MTGNLRKLIYVPIIHTSADLGSLAPAVARRGIAGLGEEFWTRHQTAVEGFWQAIAAGFNSVNVSGMKLYQDGMVAEGEVGQEIVAAGVKAGSRNYELVDQLLRRGAVLVKTEDFALVKQERDRLLAMTQTSSTARKLIAFLKYQLVKNRLLKKRDLFIAQQIANTLPQRVLVPRSAETGRHVSPSCEACGTKWPLPSAPGAKGPLAALGGDVVAPMCRGDVEGGPVPRSPLGEGGTGILFIGAYHNIRPKLPADIRVHEVKEIRKVRDYQRWLPFYRTHKEPFEALSRYLVAPVDVSILAACRALALQSANKSFASLCK